MKYDFYFILIENGKKIHKSGDFEKLLNFTVKTKNAVITTKDGEIIWKQNP